jgi:Fusaric acid resistance protein family
MRHGLAMSDAVDQHNGRTGFASRLLGSVGGALPSGTSALLFGVRLWLAVCLALYVAFWLDLDNAFWAGTSAALVCQLRWHHGHASSLHIGGRTNNLIPVVPK